MTESKKSESKKLPYLDRAEGEKLARELIAPMVERVRHKLGLDIPREEPKKKQMFVEKTAVATETPTVKVEVMTKVTQNFPAGKDVDDSHISSPFDVRRRSNKKALQKQQEEEDKQAEAVVPAKTKQRIAPVRVTESEQKRVPAQEESEDRRMKTFVESVSDGELLILMNENGSKAYYRRSGDDLVGRNDSTVKTESAWKRHQNGWKLAESDIKAVPKEIPAKQDVEAPLSGAHTDDADTEEDYASGKVFADQYLELHPPLAEAGESEKPEESKTIDGKISEQYGELFLGDMWVAKNSDGSEKRILITAFPGYGMVDIRKGADASKLREELQGGMAVDDIIAGTIDLEVLRNTLREDGYTREDRGSKSERDFSETEKVDSPHSPESPEQQKIDELRILVGEYRMKYVREDVEIKSKWEKLRRVLGLKKDEEKRQYKEMYEKALQDLRDAEMKILRNNTSLRSEEQRKGIEKLLRYYKIEEVSNLISAHDQCRMEAKSWPQKVVNSGRAIGEWYNKQSFKKKILIGSLVTLGVAGTGLAGGGALVGSSVLLIKKIIASAGLSVALDARADQKMTMNFQEQAQKEIDAELERIFGKDDEETSHRTQGEMWDHFDEKLAQSSGELSPNFERLVSERKLNGVKSVALGFGIVFGGGAVVQYGMNELGGNEAVDWTKNHIANAFYGSEVPPANIPIPAEPKPLIPVETQPIANPDVISDMLGKEYVVQKGDSVWKIAGGLADKLGLKDAQRTYFIDTLKDQYGDVQLKTGETINFSNHGIDKEFVEKALGRSTSLTIDQTASIDANDAKIAGFASSHPDITLTNESVNDILHGNTADVANGTGQILDDAVSGESPVSSDGGVRSESSLAVEENIALTDPKAYLMEHPEDFSRFNTTLGRIRMNIFTMNGGEAGVPTEYDYTANGQKLGATKISDVLKDVNGFENENLRYGYDRTQNPLHYDQMKELARFTEASEKAFGVKFSQVEAGENIDHYTRRMATAALRTGKEIKGFFKP